MFSTDSEFPPRRGAVVQLYRIRLGKPRMRPPTSPLQMLRADVSVASRREDGRMAEQLG